MAIAGAGDACTPRGEGPRTALGPAVQARCRLTPATLTRQCRHSNCLLLLVQDIITKVGARADALRALLDRLTHG